jgi:hypothetical protein
MISTCAGIDKCAFYLDFKGVLSPTPQVSVLEKGEAYQLKIKNQ